MKKIKINEADLLGLVEKFKNTIFSSHILPKKVSYDINFNTSTVARGEERPKIVFTEIAYQKMTALISQCSKEIGWHGVCSRDGLTFYINDLLMFPQTVTGATVTTDDYAYQAWLEELTDEEINNCRYYGHSHVNMATSPSGTDDNYQNDLMQNIRDYYIFGIHNKKGEMWWNIYDIENNILYEKADIDVVYPINDAETWAAAQIQVNVETRSYNYNSGGYQNTGYEYGKVWDRRQNKYVWPEELDKPVPVEDKEDPFIVAHRKQKERRKELAKLLPYLFDEEDDEEILGLTGPTEEDCDNEEEIEYEVDEDGHYEDENGIVRDAATGLPLSVDDMDDDEYQIYMSMVGSSEEVIKQLEEEEQRQLGYGTVIDYASHEYFT